MNHLGDITKIHDPPRAEVVIGGSPCQDLSVAGKRAGLAGERSGLFMEQIRLIKEMRDNDIRIGRTDTDVFPRFMVWENVPGALSSNRGEDFRAVLEETVRVADKNAAIPRYEGGVLEDFGRYHGRRILRRLARTRRAVLGSTPASPSNRAYRRFWRTRRTRDTI